MTQCRIELRIVFTGISSLCVLSFFVISVYISDIIVLRQHLVLRVTLWFEIKHVRIITDSTL